MNITLTARRISGSSTDISISFSGIKKEGLVVIDSKVIEESGNFAVILQIINDDRTRISSGTESAELSVNAYVNTNVIRVMYWNDTDSIETNVACFKKFLQDNGLDRNAPLGSFDCPVSSTKAITIPRQAGNGGVVRIVDRP